MEPYENLANAIIKSAAQDYREALKALKKKPSNKAAMDKAVSCERFFKSRWYATLTSLDGNQLIAMLRKEIA